METFFGRAPQTGRKILPQMFRHPFYNHVNSPNGLKWLSFGNHAINPACQRETICKTIFNKAMITRFPLN
ncbi:MAG: hypothetical protein QM786_13735 [Breznakibacter sp.]